MLTELFDGCACSNGLDWTADGKTMFYIDTPRQMVEQFDFDVQTGTLSGRRKFRDIPPEWGKPDGMCLDDGGDLWIALWDGGGVICVDSFSKAVIRRIDVPCPKASCCSFGGPDMDTLFITTAAMDDAAQYPLAGKTFTCKPGVVGRAAAYYKGE